MKLIPYKKGDYSASKDILNNILANDKKQPQASFFEVLRFGYAAYLHPEEAIPKNHPQRGQYLPIVSIAIRILRLIP